MFSSRLLIIIGFAALTAAYPADNGPFPRPITAITEADFDEPSPWFRFPAFGNIFAPLTRLFSSFADIGPRIESDDEKFRVIVNVKDYSLSDLKVKVKGDFILVQGSHEAKQDDHDLFASQFVHTYSLPVNASASDVTAKLTSDKYLIITAPLNGAGADDGKIVDREVPIVESKEAWKSEDKEDKDKKPADVPVQASDVLPVEIDEAKGTTDLPATVAEEEDKKELTTPSNREEVTVRDIPNEVNEISSSNEVQP